MFERLQPVMQRISRPCQLPGEKIAMTVLLVEVGEDEKHQQGYCPWDEHQTCGHANHSLTVPYRPPLPPRRNRLLVYRPNPVTRYRSKQQVSSASSALERVPKYLLMRCIAASAVFSVMVTFVTRK